MSILNSVTYTKEERLCMKKEVLDASAHLGPDYINIVTDAFPEYNTPEGRTKVRNVKNGIIADRRIACILKAIARQRIETIEHLRKLGL